VGVIFSLQESVHICAQENTQTTESIFADYGDENGGETDTAEQITGTGAEENTEQTTEETETGKNTEQTTEETENGKNTEQAIETETGELMKIPAKPYEDFFVRTSEHLWHTWLILLLIMLICGVVSTIVLRNLKKDKR